MAEWLRFAGSALLAGAGAFVLITAVLGLFRFRSALWRIHAAALVDTLGILLVLLGLMTAEGFSVTSLKLAAVVLFLWLTSPVGSHLIARLEVTTSERLSEEAEILSPAAVEEQKEAD